MRCKLSLAVQEENTSARRCEFFRSYRREPRGGRGIDIIKRDGEIGRKGREAVYIRARRRNMCVGRGSDMLLLPLGKVIHFGIADGGRGEFEKGFG